MSRTPTAPTRRHPLRWRVWLGLFVLLAIAAGMAAAWTAYERLGRTPAELLDYVERRLQGHTKLEWATRPALNLVRAELDAPRVAERALAFVVPPPPPRRGPGAVPAPEATPAGTTVWRVGPGEKLTRIADAARLAKDGDIVEIQAGDYHGDVATWRQQRLTIRGVGGAARLFAAGRSAEGKAIWVIRNGEFDISNIDFVGARVSDGNGAGIRFERGTLRLRHCLFWDNQMGLVTAGAEHAGDSTLDIASSEFAYSHVKGRWGHNLYAGSIGLLRVTGSYFHHAGVGHLLKSRARVTELRYNRFTDEAGGRASYELNFPNGGQVQMVGNIVQQQPRTENGKMISFGEEGYKWPLNTLQMANNTLVNDLPHGGSFVYVAPGADAVLSANNLRVGPGRDRAQDHLTAFNDQGAGWPDFVGAARHDYRLREPGPSHRYRRPPASAGAWAAPTHRYAHPTALEPLPGPPLFVGGEPR
ncbi:hypothetical protein [Pseudorhodoferax sp.]|uniref:hypothetical protein n=1 Tax=Pseudorhodoferax sp. TaxID=1993553 RepID=UPI002DD63FAF|nr:hypothetical protein [Pseudorhodoferax sp.]